MIAGILIGYVLGSILTAVCIGVIAALCVNAAEMEDDPEVK